VVASFLDGRRRFFPEDLSLDFLILDRMRECLIIRRSFFVALNSESGAGKARPERFFGGRIGA
jgi:hypothetical protein